MNLWIFLWAGFRRKEFRGKLAIAITANFKNRNTSAEAKVEEISGVAFIFNQRFFQELQEDTGQSSPPPEPSVQISSNLLTRFRDRPGEHCVLQRRHSLLCNDGEEAEPAGQRSHSAGMQVALTIRT